MSQNSNLRQAAVNANLVGQVGCVTSLVAVLIIAVAFGIGWFLDDFLGNERQIITALLLLGSFPITLYAMVRISLYMVGRTREQVEEGVQGEQENKEDTTL